MSQVMEHEEVVAPYHMPMDRERHAAFSEVLTATATALVGAAAAVARAAAQQIPTARFGDLMAGDARDASPFSVNSRLEELLANSKTASHTAVLGQLAALPLVCARNGKVADLTARFAASKSPTASFAEVRTLINAVKDENRAACVDGMVRCIERAMKDAGMQPSGASRRGHDVEVRSIDEQGRGLRTALLFDKSGKMSMRTKLNSFKDGACQPVLDRFNASLEEQGVRTAGTSRNWRNEGCQVPTEGDQRTIDTQRNTQRQ